MARRDNDCNRYRDSSASMACGEWASFRFRHLILGAAVALALTACQATVDTRVYVPTADDLERVKPGVQGRE